MLPKNVLGFFFVLIGYYSFVMLFLKFHKKRKLKVVLVVWIGFPFSYDQRVLDQHKLNVWFNDKNNMLTPRKTKVFLVESFDLCYNVK